MEMFRDVSKRKIAPFGSISACRRIHRLLTWRIYRKNWIDSSGKSDPPPDFYDPKHKLMMEVMRIDDHAFVDQKGHIHNESLKHEGELYKKYLRDLDRDDLSMFIIPDTKLPTNDEHNYERYVANFERVFKHHEGRLELYNTNHPGFKTIFFILDESCAYQQATDAKDVGIVKEGNEVIGMPHFFCSDKRFVDIIKNSKVDYVVWYAPYKLLRYINGRIIREFPLPKCAIYDVKHIQPSDAIEYDLERMMSAEE